MIVWPEPAREHEHRLLQFGAWVRCIDTECDYERPLDQFVPRGFCESDARRGLDWPVRVLVVVVLVFLVLLYLWVIS